MARRTRNAAPPLYIFLAATSSMSRGFIAFHHTGVTLGALGSGKSSNNDNSGLQARRSRLARSPRSETAEASWMTTSADMEAVSPVVANQQDQDEGWEEEGERVPGSDLEEDLSESLGGSRRKKGPLKFGPRKAGDCVWEGFTGTRRGFDLIKDYEVPDDPPTDLPDGEEEGYPMLIYQFMHAQYREEFPSQSSARKTVRRKELLLNGMEVRNDAKVKPGDVITSQMRSKPGLFPQGKPSVTLKVVWEDDFMAVVVKPPGVAVHGGTGEDDPGPGGRRSVRQSLPYMLTPTKSDDHPMHRPLHVHRLDKPTGGLLICAKTRPALSALCIAFEKRLVKKRYTAMVAGQLEGSGAIVTPLDHKACLTNYRARGPVVRSLMSDYISTVDLWPVTGRFHQLRRHLASIGLPILGDKRYTPEDQPLQEGGMFLWAVGLTFPHPITGEELNFSLPEPAKFERWREREHRRWLELHEQGGVPSEGVSQQGPSRDPRDVNRLPEVEGLQVEEREGFRYYQYDWSVVGGIPSPLSMDDIDDTVESP